MAIATKPKPKASHHKKRKAQHHRQSKHYVKSYWPYLPMVAIIGAGLFVNSLLAHNSAVLGEKSNLTQAALLQATNEDRLQNTVPALQHDPLLQLAAQAKANDMVKDNYWAHVSPTGEEPWKFVIDTGYQYQAAGENLAYGFSSPTSIMNAWMQSTDHRANLLNGDYQEVGFGVVQAPDYLGKGPETIVVAMYATPASASSEPATTSIPDTMAPVSRLETLAAPALSGLIVGIIGTIAVTTVLVRHSFAWRRMLNRGEMFVIHHPKLDIALVGIAVLAVLLNHTTGFIG